MVLFSCLRGRRIYRPVIRSLMIGLLAGGVGIGTSALHAQDTTIVVQGKQDPRNKKVCKIIDPPTGSRIGGGRVCRPAVEWELEEQQAQRAVQSDVERQKAMNAYIENQKGALAAPGKP